MKHIKPMLCMLGDESDLKRKEYFFEPKVDGTRAVCYVDKKMKFINRRDRDITYRYPEFKFRKKIKAKTCILDGEIIVYDNQGNPNFHLLQAREQISKKLMIELRSTRMPATYVVFDILQKDGEWLLDKPIEERKKILQETVDETKHLEYMYYTKKPKQLWKIVKQRQLEGVIAKKLNSPYLPNKRPEEWIKIKYLKTIDCVILGYLQIKRNISSLALGVYHNGKLKYIGRVGTGFTDKFLDELYKKFQKIKRDKPVIKYTGKSKIHWIEPTMVCEVRFLEFTRIHQLRAPAFLRLRFDKKPEECTLF